MSWERRRIGGTSAVLLVIANSVGAGVFTTSGFALVDLPDRRWVLGAWLLGGAVAMCGAASYGAFGRRLPESGGEYLLLSRFVHPLAGFLSGWISLLAGFTAPLAVAALVFEAYLTSVFDLYFPERWAGSLALVAAGLLHGVQLRRGILIQNLAVALKLVVLIGFALLGAWLIDSGAPTPTPPSDRPFDLGAFAVTLVWISFAYSGWNAAIYVAGELRDPQRNLARALVIATLVVTVLYLALNAVFLYAAPTGELAGKADIGAVAAEHIGGAGLRRAAGALVALALFTSISSMVMTGPRVYARMARDGLLPRLFAAGADVPSGAVAAQVALALVVLWAGRLADLLGYVGFTLGLSASGTVAAAMYLRIREGADRVPLPGFPLVPVVFIGFTLGASAFLVVREPGEALLGALTALTGLPVYWYWRRGR